MASYAYDGAGQRVAQSVTTNGTTSTTRYLAGGLEEVTTSGSPATTTLTKYEAVPGVCSVVIVGSGPSETVSYVTTDGLGSVSEALDGNGNVTAQQLYGPYGGMRYSSGTMPTAKGYTGQYADAATGLDYYNARYYDPAIGQFTSADSVDAGGLNRYAYVAGNPETDTDPTGHAQDPNLGGGSSSPPPPGPKWVDYGPWIVAHRFDVLNTPPDIYDQRGYFQRFLGSSDDKRTYDDGVVLMKYFGLSVIVRNEQKGRFGRTSDYLVGIVRLGPGPMFPYTEGYMEAGTPMDLYTPVGSDTSKIIAKAQSKWNQAPVIVMDISSNNKLKGYSKSQLENDIGSQIVTDRDGQGPYRVIFIKDGAVYDDYDPSIWGPQYFNPNVA